MVVPISRIADFVTYIKEVEGRFDFQVKMFGHAGDGNIHVYTCSNDLELELFRAQVAGFMELLYDKAIQWGGQISGEHGIGLGKERYLARAIGPVQLRLMQEIKKAFDPKGILNPASMLPAGGRENLAEQPPVS